MGVTLIGIFYNECKDRWLLLLCTGGGGLDFYDRPIEVLSVKGERQCYDDDVDDQRPSSL